MNRSLNLLAKVDDMSAVRLVNVLRICLLLKRIHESHKEKRVGGDCYGIVFVHNSLDLHNTMTDPPSCLYVVIITITRS